MAIAILALLTSLAIAAVAGYTSIIGLMALFSASALTVGIIAGILEVAKLVTASWLYRNWKTTSLSLKTYLTTAVVILMFITSMGIFGFLSKAYLEQTTPVSNNTAKIERIDKKIEIEQNKIADSEKIIEQLDAAVDTLIEYDRIRGPSGAIAVRESQEEQRQLLSSRITESRNVINGLEDERFTLNAEVLAVEAEIGPLKYVAALIYDNPEENLDNSVRIIILLLIFVFDPLAVLLLIAANQSLMRIADAKKTNPTDPEDSKEDSPNGTSATSNESTTQEFRDMGADDGKGSREERHNKGAQHDIPGSSETESAPQMRKTAEIEDVVAVDGQEETESAPDQRPDQEGNKRDDEFPTESEVPVRDNGPESSAVREDTPSPSGIDAHDETLSEEPEDKSSALKRKKVIVAKLPSNVASKYQKK